MGKYKSDLRDVLFNLNEVLEVQKHTKFGMGESDIKDILNQYDKFVENEIFPTREKSDVEGVHLTDKGVKCPEILKPMHKGFYENGWFALGLPEEIGGTPVSDALQFACLSLSSSANCAWMMYPVLSKAALNVINKVGDEYLRSTYVEKMVSGIWGGTMCLTEAGAGSDVGALKTTAQKIEGKKYKIKGTKIFISSGDNDLYDNMIHLVLARTQGAPDGTKGISLFVVPKLRVNADGSLGKVNDVKCTKVEHKMGIHASATCVLNFGDAGECEGYLIGEEFQGMGTMFLMMNEARLGTAIQGESQANLAYQMAETYAKERVQFGKEIINHPDIKKNLLRMRALSRGMRALCLYTGDLFDCAHDNKALDGLIGLLTPICKSYCSETGFNVCVDAMQVHGGYGYCSEYGMEQFVRDTKIATIYEGANGIQAIDLLMRKVLKDGGKSLQSLMKEIMTTLGSLDENEFKKEKDLFQKVLASAQSVMGHIGGLAQQNKMDHIMQHCSDFLMIASQLVVSWRLMVHAHIAQQKLSTASGDDKKYYQSKILDFKVYCSHFLVHNLSIGKTITDLEQDLSHIHF